jgi:hypothetical protein
MSQLVSDIDHQQTSDVPLGETRYRSWPGVVVQARTTRPRYTPGAAQAMLRRKRAGTVVDLDKEGKAGMLPSLLVVLVGDRGTRPVVNAGLLYT